MKKIKIEIIIPEPIIITFKGKEYVYTECPGYKDYIAYQVKESLDLQDEQVITVEFTDD